MLKCPECGNEAQGQIMGHEVRGVYDGVLVWQCMACGHAWPREFGIGRRDQAAKDYAHTLNEARYADLQPEPVEREQEPDDTNLNVWFDASEAGEEYPPS